MRNWLRNLALISMLALSCAAFAAGLPPSLEGPLFRLVLTDTPEGLELASRLLGRPLADVTGREADEALEALRESRNTALIEDLTARVQEIQADAQRPGRRFRNETERVVFVQELSARELPIDAGAEGGTVRFRGGETHVIEGNFSSARDRFFAGGGPGGGGAAPSPEIAAKRSAAELRLSKESLDQAESGDRQARLVETMEKSLRAVDDLEKALNSASPDDHAPVPAERKRALEKLVNEIAQADVSQRMNGILSPAGRNRHARLIRDYLGSRRRFEQLANRITFLAVR